MAKSTSTGIFNIEAGLSFVDVLVEGILARYGDRADVLTKTQLLLPNRRAVRAVHEAFLRASKGRATLLPRLRAVGDVEEDELHFETGFLEHLDLDITAPIDPLMRQLTLARLISAWHRRTGREPALIPAEAAQMAKSLARLIDQVETEQINWSGLQDLAPERFSNHWQETLQFLEIVTQAWPEILAERQAIDPATRRNKLLELQATIWKASPPDAPVIAAGSTGSLPATRGLFKVISKLDKGMLILPGLDGELDDILWQDLSQTHPQYGMKHLLEALGIQREDVQPWVDNLSVTSERHTRIENARLAFSPKHWAQLPSQKTPLPGVALIDAPGEREEASAIALIMREALETPGQTAALVSTDQKLARRVSAALGRWGINVDNSAGTPLMRTPAGRFLRLVGDAVAQQLAPAPLLALLKHPFTTCGMDKLHFHTHVRRFERTILRGVRPPPGLTGLAEALGPQDKNNEELRAFYTRIKDCIEPFETRLQRKGIPLKELVECHIQCAEALCREAARAGAQKLWANPDGDAAAQFCAQLLDAAPGLGSINGDAYSALFTSLMDGEVVRASYGSHPRLFIWGTIEARLQAADIMILGGLNEGSWPSPPSPDPWMSEPMRVEFGLPAAERRIGLAAHDFVQSMGAQKVYLTRAEKVDGSPSVPSRWITALKTLYGPQIERAGHYLDWAYKIDEAVAHPIAMPAPKPPLSARPKRASVTQIETWRRDPYAFYASEILKLKPLDPLDQDPGAIERGIIIHDILETYLKGLAKGHIKPGLDTLIQIGKEAFQTFENRPSVQGFWWPRFLRIADWFIKQQRQREQARYKVLAIETRAEWHVADFSLIAKADRIDATPQGGIEIIDYKTGGIPTKGRIEAGYAPQLPLEGVMASEGAFEEIDAYDGANLSFWRLSGSENTAEIRPVKDADQRIKDARAGLLRHIEAFAKPGTPFLPSPLPEHAGYGDYDHLARIKEWRGPLSGEDSE